MHPYRDNEVYIYILLGAPTEVEFAIPLRWCPDSVMHPILLSVDLHKRLYYDAMRITRSVHLFGPLDTKILGFLGVVHFIVP
jgi:hypothetical protein